MLELTWRLDFSSENMRPSPETAVGCDQFGDGNASHKITDNNIHYDANFKQNKKSGYITYGT